MPGEETSSAYFSRTAARCPVTRSQRSSETPPGWSMNRRTSLPPTTSASSTSTSGSASARRASISAWILLMFTSTPLMKKAGERPLSENHGLAAETKAVPVRRAPVWGLSGLCRALPVEAIIVPLRAQLGRQREWFTGLLVAPQLHQRAAEAEQREVVRRRPLDDRLELHAGALVLGGAE